MKPINYDALIRLRKTANPGEKPNPHPLRAILVLTGIIPAMIILFAILSSLPPRLAIGGSLLIFPLVVYLGIKQYNKFKGGFEAFVKTNGWQITKGPVTLPPRQGLLGEFEYCKTMVNGTFDKMQFWLNEAQFKNSGSGEMQPFLEILLNTLRPVEDFLLMPKSLSILAPVVFRKQLRKFKELSLEGDFDKTYRLFEVPGGEINALSFITPEVMEQVVHAGSGAVIYANSGVCSIMNNDPGLYYENIQPLFDLSQRFSKELNDKYG